MRISLVWYGLRCRSLSLARRGHGGTAYTQRELERLALLEQSMAKPAAERASQNLSPTPALTATYLRDLPQRVERIRRTVRSAECNHPNAYGETGTTEEVENTTMTSSTQALRDGARQEVPQVATLTEFLSACKRYRIQYGSHSDPVSRRQGREAFRLFWARHASSAVACCYQGIHDLGFVASVGLADDGLHLELGDLRWMLRILQAERTVASSTDCTCVLNYLARELHYWEMHGRDRGTEAPDTADLSAFRFALTDMALERLSFFFVKHSPLVKRPPTDGGDEPPSKAATVPRSSIAIATGVDALCGLEVLAILHAHDASEEAIQDVWSTKNLRHLRSQRKPPHLQSLPTLGWCGAGEQPPIEELADEVQYLLVAELFRFASAQRRNLRITDIVHAYALLRVHLRLLWPPYAAHQRQQLPSKPSPTKTVAPAVVAELNTTTSLEAAGRPTSSATPPSCTPTDPTIHKRLPLWTPLWYEKDTLFRVTWGLAIALVKKDRALVSNFHFVKIIATLAKLPAFVLSPEPVEKKVLQSFPLGVKDGKMGVDQKTPYYSEQAKRTPAAAAAVPLRPSDFWGFVVAKACVFVPNSSPAQRRIICRGIHLAITEKRAELLNAAAAGEGLAPRFAPRKRRGSGTGFAVARRAATTSMELLSTGDEHRTFTSMLLRPLVEEMAEYSENYEACLQPLRSPVSRQRGHRPCRAR